MIEIVKPKGIIDVTILISGSKSISNRLLLLNHFLKLNQTLINCSESEDTRLLNEALQLISSTSNAKIDIKHAGTNMRFLTALLSATKGDWVLTGSERMKQRPIAELVNALQQVGARISYIEKEGFPPLKIIGGHLNGNHIQMDASISSQFVSALILVAALLENGLTIETKGTIVSKPYVIMTIELLKQLGQEVLQVNNAIHVNPIRHKSSNTNQQNFEIESDWSSASYWYSICALSKGSRITLESFKEKSLQADSALVKLYDSLGVKTIFENNGIILQNQLPSVNVFEYDFTDCPDIAQTIAVTCFALGIKANLKGLKTLKMKETDRIFALRTELEKCGATVTFNDESVQISSKRNNDINLNDIYINTYQDHRMALSFAPLAFIFHSVIIDDEQVIEKSYPGFWKDLRSAGFRVEKRLG